MVEKQDLGKTSENRRERQPHVCPACKREFKGVQDYPRVFIASISLVTPDDVPAELPNRWMEDLLVAPEEGWKRELVPVEVLEYFRSNPEENKLVHSDNFIYHRPDVVSGDRYERQFNYAPAMRALLEQNVPLREYLESLRQMVGQEVPTREVFPKWQQHSFPNVFYVPSGLGVPNADKFLLRLSESKDRPTESTEYRLTEVGIWRNTNMGSAGGPAIESILPIGVISYEGRVNRT